ncbi:MAG: tRNA dihydrouridine synthase DusB [Actinomycetaceae bacterium]|nr:tRNA dihydrouridine synthase DusB [Actinomycetaceae bacterium]
MNVPETVTGALQIGPINLWAPVVLAPMAGVTDVPFRRLSREAGERGLPEAYSQRLATAQPGIDAPAGLYVCEMITARALIEGNEKTRHMIAPDPLDRVRSVQLYGVDPATMGKATEIIVRENLADHIDLNFGCPVPKVTRKGGGAALPWKLDLFEDIIEAVVEAARRADRDIPVTIKMRVGIDDEHQTYLDAGRIAEDHGVAAVALHGRTQAQYYSGHADWETIAKLKECLDVPVMGNGDIFNAGDARAMMDQTGCDAVVIGRGAQGRPWLFTDLVATLLGDEIAVSEPNLGDVCDVIRTHAELMVANARSEFDGMRNMRKHVGWYLRGFRVGGPLRQQLSKISSMDELNSLLNELDPTEAYPPTAQGKRGRSGGARKPHLPDGWLQSRTLDTQGRLAVAAGESYADGG